jgi:hypothetical protein
LAPRGGVGEIAYKRVSAARHEKKGPAVSFVSVPRPLPELRFFIFGTSEVYNSSKTEYANNNPSITLF